MILKKNHKLSLDKFINYCLYDKKNGYYMTKNPFGKFGDFTTAPNISRLYSEMIAIWIISFWQGLKSPRKINLIELGAGNGEMMRIMIESFKRFPLFLKSCNIMIYEKSPKLIKEQKKNNDLKKIKWIKNFTKLNGQPCIFIASEFFDAIPIKQFLKDKNDWYERYVYISNKKKINFTKKKIDIKNLEKKLKLNISYKQNFIEFSPLGFRYLNKILNIIKKNKGSLLIVDYGYFHKNMKNTLQALYKKRYSKILENIGSSDITYSINFYILKKIVETFKNLDVNYTTQKKFLINLGIYQRAEILSKNKTFSEKIDLFHRLKRLVHENEMGKLFKVMLIKNSNIKTKVGF